MLDRDFVFAKDTTPERLASVIVHELTHARLGRAGFEYGNMTRVRLERVCVLAERNFIARLPPSAERIRLEVLNGRYFRAGPDYWSERGSRGTHQGLAGKASSMATLRLRFLGGWQALACGGAESTR